MPENIELRHLRYFVALAGEQHFGRASAALHVTQPLLSRQIRALEKVLGVPLLQATRPKVELTPAGQLLFEHGQRTLQQVERLSRAVQQAALGRETLAIAFEPCSSFHEFAKITRKLAQSMPALRLEIFEIPVTEHPHCLRSGQIDLAYGHRGEPVDGIQFATLVSEPLLIGLHSGHPLSRRKEVAIPELDESFVFWHRSIAPACHDYILSVIRREGIEPKIKHLAPDHGKLLEMIAAGLGWTIAPACTHKAKFPGLRLRPIHGAKTKVDLGLSYLSTRAASLRAVISVWKQLSEISVPISPGWGGVRAV